MRIIHLLAPFLPGAVLAACVQEPAPIEPPPPPLGLSSSFEIAAAIAYPPDADPYALPDFEQIVLRLDDVSGGEVAAIWGASQGSAVGSFTRDGDRLVLREPVGLLVAPREPFSFESQITFDAVELVLLDRDQDQDADAVEGSGRGFFTHVLGDVEYTHEITVVLRGERDLTPPAFEVIDGAVDHHVLDGLRIQASEPLLPGLAARISDGATSIELAPVPANEDYVRAFVSSVILPFGAELSLEVDPVPQDLAGLSLATALPSVRTMPDPGLFAEDGFEGPLAAVLEGAEVVTGVGTLPPIAGASSLLIEPGEAVTVRVPVTADDTHLRIEARMLVADSLAIQSFACPGFAMRAGFVGLDVVDYISYSVPGDVPGEATGDPRWSWAGPVATTEVVLPANASEVIFHADQQPLGPGIPCPLSALLIDDLRVE
jgi:hypothetical protein